MAEGYRLPADPTSFDRQRATGFCTPTQDKRPQIMAVLPRRVIPVIFLPGIMGSNLRITDPVRQKLLKQTDNRAWRPDDIGVANVNGNTQFTPRERQLRLDPATTTVDVYDPAGPKDVSGDGRHANVKLVPGFTSALLLDDVPGAKNGQTAEQKARRRGWGEVYYDSYGALLQKLESRLNRMFWQGQVHDAWLDVVGVDPSQWQADPALPQQALTEDELKKVATGCWFPVYAFGFNWLQSKDVSAIAIAKRINAVIDTFVAAKFHCDKVIVVTHSMGGLVGRALIHPKYGNMADKILGIVHGVQPAIGAAAGYKRMRAGFEDPGLLLGPSASIAAKVAGNYGDEVTAVLANSPGGLQLLPSEAYGNGWLKVTHNGMTLRSWPVNGDPYDEIYKVQGKWYSLINEKWINPSKLDEDKGGGTMDQTIAHIDKAKHFHRDIAGLYHACSYAHYGADKSLETYGEVVWNIDCTIAMSGWESWLVRSDTKQGQLVLVTTTAEIEEAALAEAAFSAAAANPDERPNGAAITMPPERVHATILPPTEPGDETVPSRSADDRRRSGIFKGIFRQTGYDHQGSYKNDHAVASTLYSIIRIAQQAT